MSSWGRVERARDLRTIVRLDDIREQTGEAPYVEAAVLTTHDLNLLFVLAELLPGYLLEPDEVPAGLGPGHRSYRGAMLDLPQCALVFAPEAAIACDTPWRPPSLHVCPYRGHRRQHAKVTAILYRVEGARSVRLIASSANLTRRGFAANLEVAAFEDYPITGRKWPSLHALRELLGSLAQGSTLGESRAYQSLMEVLPEQRGHRTGQAAHFVHSGEPDEYGKDVARWLNNRPTQAGEYDHTVLISPFFSARGDRLKRYFIKNLDYANCQDERLDLVLDGRTVDVERVRRGDAPFTTPPAWLEAFRGAGSATYQPAFLKPSRGDESYRGTGVPGRALHAKLLGVGYKRKRAKIPRLVWRILAGSSNFTEAGFGLLGEQSNIEAGFLLEHAEQEPGDLLGAQDAKTGLCVAHTFTAAGDDRAGPDLAVANAATARGKKFLAVLDDGALAIVSNSDGTFSITISLPAGVEAPDVLRLGKDKPFERLEAGRYQLTTDTLAPFYVAIQYGELSVQWPFPASHGVVEAALLRTAAARRRVDRLMDYWLRQAGSIVEPDEEELSSDPALNADVTAAEERDIIGSWSLNRLLLGVRRRLAESVAGQRPRLPAADALISSVRTRELFTLSNGLDTADRAYFGTLLRALLCGYAASEESRKRAAKSDATDEPDSRRWRAEDAWVTFTDAVDAARHMLPEAAVEALDVAADALFESIRTGAVVE